MIDLHTHTTFSDGALIPAELARRAASAGYRAVAMTDHADPSNMVFILGNLRRFVKEAGSFLGIDVYAGVEITHAPPQLIPAMIAEAREAGAEIVVVHGETIVEPVAPGTNLAAIEGGADVLAHPGLITPEDAALAAEKNVLLEITTRKGHSLTNGHVAAMARLHGAGLVIDNDAHAPADLVSRDLRTKIARGAGLSSEEICRAETNASRLLERILRGK
ncbi:MAG: histidinol phosphate phosphatase domain-containing protein [Desulfovibrionaceae bacterium]|nr:histidinol phosphate phosphatase domain-containing protein [Desulfovibrionaceae bacterium]MBF0514922.1 histidinol phosphate phosphatase domain-containing protein [Desulfovibrionaceae bacterium]